MQDTIKKKELIAFLSKIGMQAVPSDGEIVLWYPAATYAKTLSPYQHEADVVVLAVAYFNRIGVSVKVVECIWHR